MRPHQAWSVLVEGAPGDRGAAGMCLLEVLQGFRGAFAARLGSQFVAEHAEDSGNLVLLRLLSQAERTLRELQPATQEAARDSVVRSYLGRALWNALLDVKRKQGRERSLTRTSDDGSAEVQDLPDSWTDDDRRAEVEQLAADRLLQDVLLPEYVADRNQARRESGDRALDALKQIERMDSEGLTVEELIAREAAEGSLPPDTQPAAMWQRFCRARRSLVDFIEERSPDTTLDRDTLQLCSRVAQARFRLRKRSELS